MLLLNEFISDLNKVIYERKIFNDCFDKLILQSKALPFKKFIQTYKLVFGFTLSTLLDPFKKNSYQILSSMGVDFNIIGKT